MSSNPADVVMFFVSPIGNDSWSGLLPEPNTAKTDGPLATLHRARDLARDAKANIKRGSIEIQLRSGKYYLTHPLMLNPQDSGTQECPIVWSAYPGEKPIISSGGELNGWTPYKDGILQCSCPAAKGGKWKFRQLFLNGQRQIRSRWPKFDKEDPLYGGWAMTQAPADTGPNPHAESDWGCVHPGMHGKRKI